MTLSRRDRWLGRYGLATLNLTAGAIAAHSRDRVARLLGAATLSKGGGGSLAAFMAGQSDGFWFDFTKTTQQFREDTGPTPASTPGDVIGLALSQRLWNGQGLAAYLSTLSSVIPNGDFSGGATGWSTSPNWAITNLATASIGSTGYITSNTPAVAGNVYYISFDFNYISGGGIQAGVSGVNEPAITVASSGNHVFFAATTGTVPFRVFANSASATIDNVVVKEVSNYAATQTTAGFKPKHQTAGATFDATDDNLLTAYLAQSGANFIVAYLDVPATLAATQVICGASGSAANRCFLAFNTSGQLCGGVGSDSTSTILGATDWRGHTVVVALSFDGTTVNLYAGAAAEYSAPQNSTPTVAIPFRIGALNNNGTAGSFSGSAIKTILVGRQALTLAQFKSIRTQLLAGA